MRHDNLDYLYLNGEMYDQVYGNQTADLSFWTAQAERYGGPILELASGTGRVTLHLAENGYQVTGLDNAAPMLAEARAKTAKAGLNIRFHQADMRDFDLDELFSLIILPANTLCHLLTRADLEACLARVRAHLRPNGRFIVDTFVPFPELLINYPDKKALFAEYETEAGRVSIIEQYIYAPDTQIKHISLEERLNGEPQREGSLALRMYFPQELDALLTYNGFSIEHKYGQYDQKLFDARSGKQLIVCRMG